MSFKTPNLRYHNVVVQVTGTNEATVIGELPEQLKIGNNPTIFRSNKFAKFQTGDEVNVTARPNGNERRIVSLELKRDSKDTKGRENTSAQSKSKKIKYYFSQEAEEMFDALGGIAQKRGFANGMLLGPSGYGKTLTGQMAAKSLGMDFYRFDCARVRDPEEFFGTRELVNDNGNTVTKFIFNDFVEAIQKGNTVIVMDELNRLQAYLHNLMFRLWDSGEAVIHGEKITVGHNTIFVATINQGLQYTGTFQLDHALSNRFLAFLKVGPMPRDIEKEVLVSRSGIDENKSESIVEIVTRLREQEVQFDVSTRISLGVADIVDTGVDVRQAFEMVLMARLDSVDQKSLKDAMRMVGV